MESIEEIAKKRIHHSENGRFINPWYKNTRRNFFDVMKWLVFSKNIYREEKKLPVTFKIHRPDFSSLDKTAENYMVWLGHSTLLMKVRNKMFITDPVLWNINSFIKRKTSLPIDPEKLPVIDYVLISHGHYDHLDTRSVRFLKERYDPFFVSGPGYEKYFKKIGTSKHIILDWWEEHITENIEITSLPVQHWSKRSLFDTDKMLWCSFLIQDGMTKYYWVGDSGYYEGYKEIGEKFGPIDILFIPIGAYEPRWFMKTFHVNPEEAIQIAKDIRAKHFVPIHWGTFDLTDEPLWLPVRHLKEIYKDGSNPVAIFLEHGESLNLKSFEKI